MVPLDHPVAEAIAVAKRDLKPGEILGRIGETDYRAWAMTWPAARNANALPLGLAERAQRAQAGKSRRISSPMTIARRTNLWSSPRSAAASTRWTHAFLPQPNRRHSFSISLHARRSMGGGPILDETVGTPLTQSNPSARSSAALRASPLAFG